MPSTFFGLTIADSGLRTYQTAVNTTANNISNENTKGFSRQEATMVASEAMRVWAKYGSTGTGVEVTQIKQQRNEYFDSKYWINQSKLGLQSAKADYLVQMETYLKEEETTINGVRRTVGFSSIFGDMFNALDTLKPTSGTTTTRNAYVGKAQSLAEYFNSVSNQLSDLQSEINEVMATKVEQINSIGQKVASLTKQINIIEQQGGYANELRDERNLLIDELSVLVPVEVKERPVVNSNYPDMYTGATSYTVKINGQKLVDTYSYEKLLCVSRQTEGKVNAIDEEGLYDIYWAINASSDEPSSMKLELNSLSMSGELQALYQLRDGNNKMGFEGTVTGVPEHANDYDAEGRYKITISGTSITDIRQVTMPKEGKIVLDNKEYYYSDYKAIEKTENGKTSFTFEFYLKCEADGSPVESGKLNKLINKCGNIGESIDCMGIPYYQQQLNEFVRNFSQAYNNVAMYDKDVIDITDAAQLADIVGVNKDGKQSNPFFVAKNVVEGGEYDYGNYGAKRNEDGSITYTSDYYYTYVNAKNITVCDEALKNPDSISVQTKEEWTNGVDSYDIISKLLTLKDKNGMFRGGKAEDFLQCLLSDISVDTQKAEIFTKNYENLNQAILTQRMSVSSVDKDEEALNLVKFQNAYNLSSKLVQVLQEMYDRLILQTGV